MTALDALLAGETTWPDLLPERLSPSSLSLAFPQWGRHRAK